MSSFIDNSTGDFPKTLLIRNRPEGAIWQVYHVPNVEVTEKLSANAERNGFMSRELIDYDPSYEENWKDWKETSGWFDEDGNYIGDI